MKLGEEDRICALLGLAENWQEKARAELCELGRELEVTVERALRVAEPGQEGENKGAPTSNLFFGGGLSPSL